MKFNLILASIAISAQLVTLNAFANCKDTETPVEKTTDFWGFQKLRQATSNNGAVIENYPFMIRHVSQDCIDKTTKTVKENIIIRSLVARKSNQADCLEIVGKLRSELTNVQENNLTGFADTSEFGRGDFYSGHLINSQFIKNNSSKFLVNSAHPRINPKTKEVVLVRGKAIFDKVDFLKLSFCPSKK